MTELKEAIDLGSGFGFDPKAFPDGQTIDEYSRTMKGDPSLEIDPSEIHDRVFEKSLNKEIDVNKIYFSFDPIRSDIIEKAQEEQNKKNNNQQFDQTIIDAYRTEFNETLPTNNDLYRGVAQTGSFPIDLSTGNVITPDNITDKTMFEGLEIKPLGSEPIDLSFKVNPQKAELQKKVEDEYKLLKWSETQTGGPQDPDALTALARAFRPSLQANFGRRVYEALGGTNEIFRFYMATFMKSIINKASGDGGNIIPENLDEELQNFRSTGMDKYLPDTDRHRIVNDLIRDELRKTLPPEEFERRGYNKTIETQIGDETVTVPAINFVTPDYANKLFEFSFDEMGLFEQLAVIVGENTIGTKIVTAPVRGLGAIYRIAKRGYYLGKGESVPFSLLSPKQKALRVAKEAELLNVSPAVATKNILQNDKSLNFLDRIFINGLTKKTMRSFEKENFDQTIEIQKGKVLKRELDLEDAVLGNKPLTEIRAIENDIALLNQNLNWQRMKLAGANIVDFGIHPKNDIFLGSIQLLGRQMYGPIGEAMAVGSVLVMGGVKGAYGTASNRFTYLPSGIPGSNFVSAKATEAKLGVENFTSSMLTLLSRNPTLTAKGLLVDPSLRTLKEIVKDQNLPSATISVVNNFAKNAQNLTPEQFDYLVKDMALAIDDIRQITKDLPDSIVAGTDKSVKQIVTENLSVSLAEMTGLNVFAGIALALDSKAGKFSSGNVARLSPKVKDKLKQQQMNEKRLVNLTNAVDSLSANILRLESGEFGNVSPEVIENLKTTARLYQGAINNGKDMLASRKLNDGLEAEAILKQLKNPLNGRNISLYTSGEGQNLLDNLFNLAKRANVTRNSYKEGDNIDDVVEVETYAPNGDIKVAKDEKPVDVQLAKIEGEEETTELFNEAKASLKTVNQHANDLIESAFESNMRLGIVQTDKQFINSANQNIINLKGIIESASRSRIEEAYSKISTKKKVRFDQTANNIINIIEANKSGSDQSLASVIIPKKGNPLGSFLSQNINKGVERSLISFFDQPEFLSMINESKLLGDKTFESGSEVLSNLKQFIQRNPDAVKKFDMNPEEGPSSLQVAMSLIESDFLPFNASDFNLLASPYEMEQIRQGMQKLTRSGNENVRGLASTIVGQLDIDMARYSSQMDINDYNAMVTARTIARLEKQRFDPGTIGHSINQKIQQGDFKYLSMDGDEITSKNMSDVFKPLINAINNPTATSEATVQQQMKKIIATFAPSSINLPPSLLTKGNDGRIITPTEDQLRQYGSQVVFDLDTEEGILAFNALNKTLRSLLRSNFVENKYWKRNTKIRADIATGREPIIQLDQFGSLTPFEFPPTVKNVNMYVQNIEKAMTITVRRKNPITGKVQDVQMPAVNVKDVFDIDNQVMNTAMASKKFEQEHANFFKLMKKQEAEVNLSLDQLEKTGGDFYERTALYKDNMTGDTFYSTVLSSGNPVMLENYISDLDGLVLKGDITLAQKQQALKATFVSTLNAAGGKGKATSTLKFYNGQDRNVLTFAHPEEALDLLTGNSMASTNFKQLAYEAGITDDQLKTYEAMFRQGVRIDPSSVIAKAQRAGRIDAGTQTGFSLTNTLSKGFNLARGLVSKEYVAADYAIRYAALSNNAIMNAVMNDTKFASIVNNLINAPERLIEGDGFYFAKVLSSFIVTDLKQLGITHENGYNKKAYWESKGVEYETTGE